MRDTIDGTNFDLPALLLTAKKCGAILSAPKIGLVKFALIDRPCAIPNASFACVKFGRAPFVKAIMRSGLFADLRPFEKKPRTKISSFLPLCQKILARSFL